MKKKILTLEDRVEIRTDGERCLLENANDVLSVGCGWDRARGKGQGHENTWKIVPKGQGMYNQCQKSCSAFRILSRTPRLVWVKEEFEAERIEFFCPVYFVPPSATS